MDSQDCIVNQSKIILRSYGSRPLRSKRALFKNITKMDTTAKIYKIYDRREGSSERGTWKRQEIIVETVEQYPRKMALQLWGDQVDNAASLREGDTIIFGYSAESRVFNDKWYTDIRAFNIRKAQPVQVQTPPQQNMNQGGWPSGDLPY